MSNNNNTMGIPKIQHNGTKKNYRLDIPEINQPDLTTRNLSHSDELTIGFLLDCAERGQNRSNQLPPSICKVSRMLRDHSESSYEPQLVSIGPIHREDPKLKEFEWLKECYLDDLLHRCYDSTPKETLEACLLKVNTLIDQIRESYAGMIENYNDVELARMMVMDGCFILEFCFKHEEEDLYLPNKMLTSRIAMDLMLLENQVPFFVLQALFDCSMGKVPFTLSNVLDYCLAPYIKLFRPLLPEKNSILSNVLDKYLAPYIKLFRSLLPENFPTTDVDSDLSEKISTTDVDHVLGYLHKCYQLVAAKKHAKELELLDEEGMEDAAFHPIVELDRSGMIFKPHQEDEWSMTIKFQPSNFPNTPALLMPTLVIDDTTELILRNFIAYEQSFPQNRYYFTSYAHAMDMLIDSQDDIAKLVKSKVIVNMLGTNQEAADMINKVCKNISITDFCYTRQFKQMDKYYNALWTKSINVPLTHASRALPWSLSNIILLYLSVIQTYYSSKAA